MTMFCANHATTAASADAACCAARTFSHNIALILDAALLASIFVAAAIVSLLGSSALFVIVISIISIISIILVTIIALLVTASGRYGEPT